ncbi:MAG: DUF6328 family protein, partial [Actinomycetota bacterium]
TVDGFEKDVFFVSFLSAAISSALLIATSSIHRIGWRVSNKEQILRTGNVLTIAGLVALAVSIVSVVLLVADYIAGRAAAMIAAAAVGAIIACTWYGLAFVLRRER